MSAIAGWVSDWPDDEAERACRTIADGLAQFYARPPRQIGSSGTNFAAGASDNRADSGFLAESARYLLAADARIDNEPEIRAALGLARTSDALTDADLILAAWDRWQEDCLDRLVGDFALAVFDRRTDQLFLARCPSGQRPLFYAREKDVRAFASMTSGLANLPTFNRGLNLSTIARALSDEPAGSASYFNQIDRVRPGQCVALGRAGSRAWQWWRPSVEPRRGIGRPDLIEEYLGVLDRAVARRIGGAGKVAAHLSSGYDSSAVAATAALQCKEPVIALTSAPSLEFTGRVPRGRIADESDLAAQTAALHDMDHRIVGGGQLTLDYMRSQTLAFEEPARNLLNGVWWLRTLQIARDEGAPVLLNGSLGNVTLNHGGLSVLAGWVRRGEMQTWWRQARAAIAHNDISWGGIGLSSFGPWIPRPLWERLRRRQLGIPGGCDAAFLRPEIATSGESSSDQPFAHYGLNRLRWIDRLDPGTLAKGAIASAGIAECDPLADRELIEFSLTMPFEACLDNGIYRPLARQALVNRVPAAVLNSPLRGLQAADWHHRFRQQTAIDILEEIQAGPAFDILDPIKLRMAIERWPQSPDYDFGTADLYARRIPIALGLGLFINEFSRGR